MGRHARDREDLLTERLSDREEDLEILCRMYREADERCFSAEECADVFYDSLITWIRKERESRRLASCLRKRGDVWRKRAESWRWKMGQTWTMLVAQSGLTTQERARADRLEAELNAAMATLEREETESAYQTERADEAQHAFDLAIRERDAAHERLREIGESHLPNVHLIGHDDQDTISRLRADNRRLMGDVEKLANADRQIEALISDCDREKLRADQAEHALSIATAQTKPLSDAYQAEHQKLMEEMKRREVAENARWKAEADQEAEHAEVMRLRGELETTKAHLENALLRTEENGFCDVMQARAEEATAKLAAMTTGRDALSERCTVLETRAREMRAAARHVLAQGTRTQGGTMSIISNESLERLRRAVCEDACQAESACVDCPEVMRLKAEVERLTADRYSEMTESPSISEELSALEKDRDAWEARAKEKTTQNENLLVELERLRSEVTRLEACCRARVAPTYQEAK
jgi:hypothetical protein